MVSSILAIYITFFALFPILSVSSIEEFSVKLIHRDSIDSPFHDPTSTPMSRLHLAAKRSRSRATYFEDAIRNSAISPSAANLHSEIIPDSSEYLMALSIGTPKNQIFAVADTGNDLTWIQCAPCNECYNQSSPLFDPKASSTYKTIPCNSGSCSTQPKSNCGSSQCQYRIAYGGVLNIEGLLSTETIGFHSASGHPVKFPNTIFGCTHRSHGNFAKNAAGLVGLGGGKLSLIRQLSSTIGKRFSYCLPNSTQTSAKSHINFGSKAIISAANAVTTPLVRRSPETFYFISLKKIKVDGKSVSFGKSAPGNTVIDSGTTLTFIVDNILQSVENKVKESVSFPQVKDPNSIFRLCFEISGAGASAKFPKISFHFSGGATMVLPQSNAFREVSQNIACLAMYPGHETNFIGNIAQQNFHIGYDLGAMQLTFARTDCSTL